MKESIHQFSAKDFTISLVDESGQTITKYNFNLDKILQGLKLLEIVKNHSCRIYVCGKCDRCACTLCDLLDQSIQKKKESMKATA